VAGNFGTRWLTQFSVFNPQLDHPLTVSVTFLPTGGGTGIERTFTVPANGTVLSDNILDDLFGLKTGSGGLLVATFPEDNPKVPNDVLSRSFLITTNTYNNVASGTYGQTIPGVWAGLQDFTNDGISAVAHGIRNIFPPRLAHERRRSEPRPDERNASHQHLRWSRQDDH